MSERGAAQAERELKALLRKEFGLTTRQDRDLEAQAKKQAIETAKRGWRHIEHESL